MTTSRLRAVAASASAASALLLLIPSILIAQVDTAWVRRYDGPAHQDDQIVDIAVDSAGNVYSVGQSDSDPDTGRNWDIVVWKLSPAGESLWLTRYNYSSTDEPFGLVPDGMGGMYVAAYLGGPLSTLRFDSLGQVQWVRRYSTYGCYDGNIASEPGGGVIVAGAVDVPGQLYNCVAIKYRPNGDTAWARQYDATNDEDLAFCLAVDEAGGSYLGGQTYEHGIGGKFLVVKYDSSGNRQWVTSFDGPYTNGLDAVDDIAVDNRGSVCFTGRSVGLGGDLDYATGRLDAATGETLWVRRYDGAAHQEDEPRRLALDSAGNVYVTGRTAALSSGYNFATVSYDSGGAQRWITVYDGPVHEGATPWALAVDPEGRVYVTGRADVATSVDVVTVCYSLTGDSLSTWTYDGPRNRWDEGKSVAVGSDGSVLVGGTSEGISTGYDFVVIKYAPSGGLAEGGSMAYRRCLEVSPNPFCGRAVVKLTAPVSTLASIAVYNAAGRRARVLTTTSCAVDSIAAWDGLDDAGRRLPPGVYVLRVRCAGQTQSFKVIKL